MAKDGKTSGYFKGVITAVEESNPGYSFKGAGCDMGTMKGKLIGFNFGEEEWRKNEDNGGMLCMLGDILLVTWACIWLILLGLGEYLRRAE